MTEAMFPNRVDRYRLLRYVLQQKRNSFRRKLGRPGLTQKELAEKLERKQSTISNVERLKYLDKLAKSRHGFSRERLLSIVTSGLKLPHESIDAVLWLVEGKAFRPIDEYELKSYAHYLGAAFPRTYEDSILRNNVLDCLEQLVRERHTEASKGSTKVNVWMIFGSDPAHNVKENRELFKIEKQDGQRMFVSKYPSFLAYSDNNWSRWSKGERVSKDDRLEYAHITTERRERFLWNLKKYGERNIHSLVSLRAYVRNKNLPHYFNLDERHQHLKDWIRLLESDQYPFYEVGLIDTPPELEFFIKSTLTVSVTGARAYNRAGEEDITCGPLTIDWRDSTSVLSFLIDFEREWHRIPRASRDRESVIRKLKALL
jgi:DNA-binding XRE family transcriptional regulator